MAGKQKTRSLGKRSKATRKNTKKGCYRIPKDSERCQAHLKGDPTKRCLRRKVAGKDYCARHSVVLRPKHGLGSKYRVGPFADLIAKFDDLPLDRVKDLTGEVTLLRGLLVGLLDTVQEAGSEAERATILWSSAGQIERMVDTIGKTAERMERIEHGLQVNLNARQVAALAGQVVAIVNQEVADPATRQCISERVANLVVIL